MVIRGRIVAEKKDKVRMVVRVAGPLCRDGYSTSFWIPKAILKEVDKNKFEVANRYLNNKFWQYGFFVV